MAVTIEKELRNSFSDFLIAAQLGEDQGTLDETLWELPRLWDLNQFESIRRVLNWQEPNWKFARTMDYALRNHAPLKDAMRMAAGHAPELKEEIASLFQISESESPFADDVSPHESIRRYSNWVKASNSFNHPMFLSFLHANFRRVQPRLEWLEEILKELKEKKADAKRIQNIEEAIAEEIEAKARKEKAQEEMMAKHGKPSASKLSMEMPINSLALRYAHPLVQTFNWLSKIYSFSSEH